MLNFVLNSTVNPTLNSILSSLTGSLSIGVLWSVMALGVYITFRVMKISDLTVDGSFSLGGFVCVLAVSVFNIHPILALLLASLSGLLAGAVTGLLHTIFDIPSILAGILTQISLYSINLMLLGKSNVSLGKDNDIFTYFSKSFAFSHIVSTIIIGIAVVILLVYFLYWLFGTELGSACRATGNNEDMIRALGVDTNKIKLFTIMLSNALVALSGALVAQEQRYADVNMGSGAIVIGLAAIVIGEMIFSKVRGFLPKLFSISIGTAVYFIIRAIVLYLGFDAQYMKLLSAVIVVFALAIPVLSEKAKLRNSYSPEGE